MAVVSDGNEFRVGWVVNPTHSLTGSRCETLQEIYDKSFSVLEKSHQRAMTELRRTHRQEVDSVRVEMDQLLKEEADATQAGFTQ